MYEIQMIEHSTQRYLSYKSKAIPRVGEYVQMVDEAFRVDYVYYTNEEYNDNKAEGYLVKKQAPHYNVILYGEVVTDLPF